MTNKKAASSTVASAVSGTNSSATPASDQASNPATNTTTDATSYLPASDTLITQRDGGVLWIRLNRPDDRNGINFEMLEELKTLWPTADADPTVRAIVITGEGRAFCTGADLRPGQTGSNTAGASQDSLLLDYRPGTAIFRDLFRIYWELETPVVSAVNGTVAGAGWMLALLADLVVAAEGARWIHVFSERGMIPHAGDPYFLPRILPFHALNEIALLRDRFVSEDLSRWGCVNRLVPAEKVESIASELAQRLASGPTRSLGQAKRLYRRSLESDMLTAFGEEAMTSALIAQTHDRAEGVKSLMEGRPAEFLGR